MANPISHAIGMLGALLIPVDRGKAVHLVDRWEPGEVLDLIESEDLSAGGGAPYFLTSLLDHPRCGERASGAAALPGDGRCSGAPGGHGAGHGDRPEHLLDVWINRAPLHHRVHVRRPARKAACRRLGGRCRAARSSWSIPTGGRSRPGEPGEILSRGPECFLGYTDASLTAKVFDRRWLVPHRRHRRAGPRRLPVHHGPHLRRHHPRGGEHQRRRGGGGPHDASRAWPRWPWSRHPTPAWVSTWRPSSAWPRDRPAPELPEMRHHLERCRRGPPEVARGAQSPSTTSLAPRRARCRSSCSATASGTGGV